VNVRQLRCFAFNNHFYGIPLDQIVVIPSGKLLTVRNLRSLGFIFDVKSNFDIFRDFVVLHSRPAILEHLSQSTPKKPYNDPAPLVILDFVVLDTGHRRRAHNSIVVAFDLIIINHRGPSFDNKNALAASPKNHIVDDIRIHRPFVSKKKTHCLPPNAILALIFL
jgi:hypothetical protein